MPSYGTILFDLDGTLIDSVGLILDSYHHTLAQHQLPPRSDDYWLAGLGTPLRVQFAEWADDPQELDEMIATYREYNLTNHDSRVTAYPGIVDVVRAVGELGVSLGLVTSKARGGATRGLSLVGLADSFQVLVCADDVSRPKPDPEPVTMALEALDADPGETLFVGDSLHDMESGRAAGVATGAVLWGPFDRAHLAGSAPDHWLEEPTQLLGLLNGEIRRLGLPRRGPS